MGGSSSGHTVAREMGGYNCVIQLAGSFILRFLQRTARFSTAWTSIVPRDDFFAALDRLATSSDILTRLRAADHVEEFALILWAELVRLRFAEAGRVCLTLRGDLVANNADATLPPASEDVGPITELTRATSEKTTAAAARDDRADAASVGPAAPAFEGGVRGELADPKEGRPVGVRSLGGVVGQVTVEVCLRYHIRAEAGRGTIEVYADGGGADVVVATSRGLDPLGELLIGAGGAAVVGDFARAGRITLTPTLSLVGADADRVTRAPSPPPSPAVTEFARFDVESVVVERDRRQALALCCVVEEGTLPSPAEVQHFLHDQDYGVRSDSALVNAVLRHKWRLGCFVRGLRIQRGITVQRRGRGPEPATLNGDVTLDTFDGAFFEFNGAARTPIVRLAGTSTITPTSLDLAGERIPASDLPRELFRVTPLSDVPWAFPFNFTDRSEWPAEPEARRILEALYREGLNPLMRPFAAHPRTTAAADVVVREAIIDGVHKTLQFRGSIPRIFA